MHQSSYNKMTELLKQFVAPGKKVLDVGATKTMWNYGEAVKENGNVYKTLDWGANADYEVNSYDWNHIPKQEFDVVISGQALEHDKYFWKTLENIKSILKSGDLVIIILPSCGAIHRYPVDCWRFYPDCAESFSEILDAKILHVDHNIVSEWGDLAMVFELK
jgi:SAM-dependent methyltransferase